MLHIDICVYKALSEEIENDALYTKISKLKSQI